MTQRPSLTGKLSPVQSVVMQLANVSVYTASYKKKAEQEWKKVCRKARHRKV
jgi:hypothetical protein